MEDIEYKGYIIKIEQDELAFEQSPRDWCNIGTMVSWHRRCTIGDYSVGTRNSGSYTPVGRKEGQPVFRDAQDLVDFIHEHTKKKDIVWAPVYLYEHGGQTIRTYPFGDPWDSGQVGFIWVSTEDIRKEFKVKRVTQKLREKVHKILVQEVETYDQWLRGDIYYYIISDPNSFEDQEDSCGGFYGYNYCLQEAKDVIDHLAEKRDEKLWEKVSVEVVGD